MLRTSTPTSWVCKMYEHLLKVLPEAALACRALYDVENGGYHIPLRVDNVLLELSRIDAYRASYPEVCFDCVEAPVADLLYALVVNTRSRWILETGTSRGFSTSHLAAGASFVGGAEARVVSVDFAPAPNPFFKGSSLATNIIALQADSLSLDLFAYLGGATFDFMFFDSLHTYAHLGNELSRYLPLLKTGGLFALHDTMVYDDLGLVVLGMMASRKVEAVSLPTHRSHGAGRRSPGVSLFRKIDRIEVGELVFPDLSGVVEGERQSVLRPAAIVERTGSLFTDPRYAAGSLHRGGSRNDGSPALLDCSAALPTTTSKAFRLERHATVPDAEQTRQADWWRSFGALEGRFFRLAPAAFAPRSQHRYLQKTFERIEGCAELVYLGCDSGATAQMREALVALAAPAPVEVLEVDCLEVIAGRKRLPDAGVYIFHGVLHYLSSFDILALLVHLRHQGRAGARIIVLEPVCFPDQPPGIPEGSLAEAIAEIAKMPADRLVEGRTSMSPSTAELRSVLDGRWWGEIPCGPAPLERPFVDDELPKLFAQHVEVSSYEVVQVMAAQELARELSFVALDDPEAARQMAVELLPRLDDLERAVLDRSPLPDISWYLAMLTAVVV